MESLLLIISAAFVFFMLFGLAYFYAGQTDEKSVTNTLLMSFGALAISLPLWVTVGHNIAFGNTDDKAFVLFQGAFAVLATAIISGSIVSRMKFGAWLVFAGIWVVGVYSILVQWVWSEEGWLFNLGAIDLAGGNVIHISAGVSGLVLAFVLGNRLRKNNNHHRLNSPLVILGAGVLTVGWIFFNSGSVLAVDETTSLVALNTMVAASIGAATWILLDAIRPKATVNALAGGSGAVAGLVGITPAAAVVNELGAAIIAVLATVAVYFVLQFKDRFPVDDALDVGAFHAVAGIVGGLAIGFVALDVGVFYGGGFEQLGIQAISVGACLGFAALATWVIATALKLTIGIRVNEELEESGIDDHHTKVILTERDDPVVLSSN